MSPRFVAVFAALALAALAAPAHAQQYPVTFTPNPAPQGAIVRMAFEIPIPGCGRTVVTNVTRTGSEIRVDYGFVPEPGIICIGVPAPSTPIALDIGGFPAGSYVVTAIGSDPAFPLVPIPPVSGTLGVFPASNVPSLSFVAAALLALVALFAGAGRLARPRG